MRTHATRHDTAPQPAALHETPAGHVPGADVRSSAPARLTLNAVARLRASVGNRATRMVVQCATGRRAEPGHYPLANSRYSPNSASTMSRPSLRYSRSVARTRSVMPTGRPSAAAR